MKTDTYQINLTMPKWLKHITESGRDAIGMVGNTRNIKEYNRYIIMIYSL